MYDTIELVKERGLATVTLNRPELNLMNRQMTRDLADAAEDISHDGVVRVVVVTGLGERAFTAGVDVHEMKDLDPSGARQFIEDLHRMILRFREMDRIVVAAINGYCLGGGCELAMACDIRLAAENVRIGLPEIQVGIPSVIEAALMPLLMGAGRAREMMLIGDAITAGEAAKAGLVGRVVAKPELRHATTELTDRLLGYSPTALRLQKKILNRWLPADFEEAIRYSIEAFSQSFASGEPHEAMSAFLEKRAPRFGE